jgi:ketosteroid isomerase-like protein
VQLVRDWLAAEARNDRAALDRLIDDGFVGATFSGSVLSKDDIVPSANDPASNRFPKSSLKEATSRRFGDTGVVVGRIAADDAQQPMEFRCTLVFQKHGDAWRMIAAHMSR